MFEDHFRPPLAVQSADVCRDFGETCHFVARPVMALFVTEACPPWAANTDPN
jgi:hypothetical protein